MYVHDPEPEPYSDKMSELEPWNRLQIFRFRNPALETGSTGQGTRVKGDRQGTGNTGQRTGDTGGQGTGDT